MAEQKAEYVWMDGEYVRWDDAKVHVTTHALHYGTGVFEGIRGYWNEKKKNVFLFRMAEHVSRLFYSAKVYRMQVPSSPEKTAELCGQVVAKNKIRETCYVRPVVYRGPGPFGLNPFKNPVRMFIYALPFGRYLGEDALEKGVKVMFTSWERISPRSLPPEVKACGQYLNSVLTPPLTASILPGITRMTVIELLKGAGRSVEEVDLTRAQLLGMDEVFMVGTAGEVTPVTQIGQIKIGEGVCGPVTAEIQKMYFNAVTGADVRHKEWLSPVY